MTGLNLCSCLASVGSAVGTSNRFLVDAIAPGAHRGACFVMDQLTLGGSACGLSECAIIQQVGELFKALPGRPESEVLLDESDCPEKRSTYFIRKLSSAIEPASVTWKGMRR